MAEPTVILGTMTFGWNPSSSEVNDEDAPEQLDYFASQGF
eukprot:SAG22_NODE_22060_length_252_cov_0.379085_1_plen_39_part_10